MARPSGRRSNVQSDRIFELGVAGRKTGVTLKDSGVRDEHGMEPLDSLFSSPEKTKSKGKAVAEEEEEDEEDDDSSDGGMEMDIDYTGGVGPIALLNGHGNRLPIPLPRSRSPAKTHLRSPPTKNPNFQHGSSAARGSVVRSASDQALRSVARRLDFGGSSMPKFPAGNRRADGASAPDDEEESDESDDEALVAGRQESNKTRRFGEATEHIEMIDDGGDDYYNGLEDQQEAEELDFVSAADPDPISEEEEAPPVQEKKRGRGRKPAAPAPEPEPEEAPVVQPRKRGRAKKVVEPEPEPEPVQEPESEPERATMSARPRKRPSIRESLDENNADEVERQSKRQRTDMKMATSGKGRGRPKRVVEPVEEHESVGVSHAGPSTDKPAPKKRGRKPLSAQDAADTSLLPRGPPLPKSQGLAIRKAEPTAESDVRRTKSGRSSYKPLAWWRGEHVDYEYDYAAKGELGRGLSKAYMPSIKEVIRTGESPPPERKTGRKGKVGRPPRREKKYEDDDASDDDAAEAWEANPGGVWGDMVLWKPGYETNPPATGEEISVIEQQVALSDQAIKPRPVRDASFKYIKTVGLPFFGAGVLELPPGTEKRPKNARKMFMTFFVQYGRVSVTVNETVFRIGKGGMFFVPRGNYYTIVNDNDRTARLFFSQACEKTEDLEGEDGTQGDVGEVSQA